MYNNDPHVLYEPCNVKFIVKTRYHIIVSFYRCDYNVEFFHYVERFPKYSAGGVQLDGHERLGRRVHVLYIRQSAGVCVGELRRAETFRLAVAHSVSEQRPRLQTNHASKVSLPTSSNVPNTFTSTYVYDILTRRSKLGVTV